MFPGTGGHSSSDDVDGGGVPNSGGSANGGGPSDVELSEPMWDGSLEGSGDPSHGPHPHRHWSGVHIAQYSESGMRLLIQCLVSTNGMFSSLQMHVCIPPS